jgi:hypothetical protein
MDSPEFYRLDILKSPEDLTNIDFILICQDDDPLCLSTGLTLLNLTRGHHIPIILRIAEEGGITTLLEKDSGSGKHYQDLFTFELLNKTCTPELLLGGTHEILAQALHEEYVHQQLSRGVTIGENPVLVPWHNLPPSLKEANYCQVDRIGAKLASIQCEIVVQADWEVPRFEFTDEEVESLARMEHEEWMEQLLRDGWQYTSGSKEIDNKKHPDLQDWEQLPDSEKDKNRIAVRELPRFLARAGFQIERTG